MPRKNLVDAGAIIAYFDQDDEFNEWAVNVFSAVENFSTCERSLRKRARGFNPAVLIRIESSSLSAAGF